MTRQRAVLLSPLKTGVPDRTYWGTREFTKSSAVERFCRDALAQHNRLFRQWHKFRSRQLIGANCCCARSGPRIDFRSGPSGHLESSHRKVRNLATALFEHNGRLFIFLEREGCDLQGLNILAYLSAAVMCHRCRQQGGSLLSR
jgi:hypothetical protein